MKYHILLIIAIICSISCKNIENTVKKEEAKNITLSEGWVSEDKYITSAIGYPNSNVENKNNKESAYNAAITLAKIKIETALLKEVKNIDENKIKAIKEIINSNFKVLEEKYVDNRYYRVSACVEKKNLFLYIKKLI